MDRGVNLDQLLLMKAAFEGEGGDGSGELTQEEFFEKLSPLLGTTTSRKDLAETFMKIDADCGGTVDWEEFTNYFFLQRTASKPDDKTDWKLFAQALSKPRPAACAHRDPIQKIFYCEPLDRFITCCQDGSFSFWNAQDMSHYRTYHHKGVWANDCSYLPVKRLLACASFNDTVTFFDMSRGAFKMAGRFICAGDMGTPTCLAVALEKGGMSERLYYGDSNGSVAWLKASLADSPDRLLHEDNAQDMEWVHQEHTDWVTQLCWQPDLGLISSSLDAAIKITDVTRGHVLGTATVHRQGVAAFVYSHAFSVVASGGLDRDIVLWEPSNLRRVGELAGHTAPITHLSLDSSASQVVSMSADHVIKLWDLRNNRCMQTIVEKSWPQQSEAHPSVMAYEPRRRRVVTATHQPFFWKHMCCADDQQGHSQPLVAVLYSPEFHLAVSGDDSGTICVWDTNTGLRDGHFTNLHGGAKLTAMTFDASGRRLLTASDTGDVSMWNFTNGSRLRRFAHDGPKLELTCLLYLGQLHQVIGAGWDRQLHIWEDTQDEEIIKKSRTLKGHKQDISCLAFHGPAMVASGDCGGVTIVWDIQNREQRFRLANPRVCGEATEGPAPVSQLQFIDPPGCAPGTLLLSASGDGCVRAWQTCSGGQLLETVEVGCLDQMASCTALAKDETEQHIAVGLSNGTLSIWKLSAQSQPAPFCQLDLEVTWTAATAAVTSLQFMKDCHMLVVASQDTSVGLWSTSGQLIGKCGQHAWTLSNQLTWQHSDVSVSTGLATGSSIGAQSTQSSDLRRLSATSQSSLPRKQSVMRTSSNAEQLYRWLPIMTDVKKVAYPELRLSPPASLAELSKWQKKRSASTLKIRR
ncbi:hypothetical protein WJX84_008712 [Apatococcus fuscideae]|uniref:EF-hand domain-containing protein n=1 Tax=Apatococcus fuscideae TaxID=2026836 RepID=A0AAW1SCA8_9CHLO